MMKVLSCRFDNCLGPFNMLTVKGCSEKVFFWESKLTKFFTAFQPCNKVGLRALSSCFSIALGKPDLKHIFVSDMLNLSNVSLHIDWKSNLFFSRFREFVVTNIIAIMFKTNNIFWIFFCDFWNLYEILNIFEKRMIVIATLFRKLQTIRDLVRPLSKKHRFRTPLDSQHVKGFQTLVKSPWEHFQHVFPSFWENLTWKISLLVIS